MWGFAANAVLQMCLRKKQLLRPVNIEGNKTLYRYIIVCKNKSLFGAVFSFDFFEFAGESPGKTKKHIDKIVLVW